MWTQSTDEVGGARWIAGELNGNLQVNGETPLPQSKSGTLYLASRIASLISPRQRIVDSSLGKLTSL